MYVTVAQTRQKQILMLRVSCSKLLNLPYLNLQFICSVILTMLGIISARLIKVEKPLYGVELFVGETARFEIELSEPDVHGEWKLKGEPLTASPVSQDYLIIHVEACLTVEDEKDTLCYEIF